VWLRHSGLQITPIEPKVCETNRLAQSTTENIVKDVDSLYEVELSGIHAAVSTALRN